MFSKIVLSFLLLTCIYTYMLKSIKNNNNIDFQQSPHNFNFELNGIQTVKPNLKTPNVAVQQSYIRMIFGPAFIQTFSKKYNDLETQQQFFNKSLLSKLKELKSHEEFIKIFDDDMIPRLKNDFDDESQEQVKMDVQRYMRELAEFRKLRLYLDAFIMRIEDRF